MADSSVSSPSGGPRGVEMTEFERKEKKDHFAAEIKANEGDDTTWTWDYVLVFKRVLEDTTEKKKKKYTAFKDETARYEVQIRKSGLHVTSYLSVQTDEVYLLVGGTEKRLRWEADRRDYDLPLNVDEILKQGVERKMTLALALNGDDTDSKNRFVKQAKTYWGRIYGKYNRVNEKYPNRHDLYQKPFKQDEKHRDSIFRTIDRLRLTNQILQEDVELHGAGLRIEQDLIRGRKDNHPLVACFPAHEQERKAELASEWLHWWYPDNSFYGAFSQPLESVRDYFGEKVAFYFLFLETYCNWLVLPAIVGTAFFIWQRAVNDVDVAVLPFYGVAMAVWGTLFLEFWKRKEATFQAEWGMTHYQEKEGIRAEFRGERIRDPVNGRQTKFFSAASKLYRLLMSQTVVWSLILVVIGAVVSIFFLRQAMLDKNVKYGNQITAIINAIQIQILNFIYGAISLYLNEFENHRTATDYENSLISKNFLFKFINSYNSLFYIAFIKASVSGTGSTCGKGTLDRYCLTELQTQLGTLFVVAIVVNNALEIGIPYLMTKINERSNRVIENAETKEEKQKSTLEEEYELVPYTTFADFDEMAIQWGYVILFVVAFPLAPFCALLNNYIEIRLDAEKILQVSQRPRPLGATGIGTWFDIFTIVSFCGVVTNTIIVIFDTALIDGWADGNGYVKCWIFIIVEHLIIILKVGIGYLVPDVPVRVRDHLARQDYIVGVLIDDVEEEAEPDIVDDTELDAPELNSPDLPKRELGGVAAAWSYDDIPVKAPDESFYRSVKYVVS